MAHIAPFRAYRFNTSIVGDLTPVVTQPYDKIGPPLRDEYYARSPYNIARVIKSKEQEADSSTDYPEAGQIFQKWLSDGVLRPDTEPGIYPYYQIFHVEGREYTRKGFVALVELEEGQVRAHEKTLAGPKADRLRLLRQIEASDELIFMLFSDAKNQAVEIMDQVVAQSAPIMDVKDDFGETHRVWQIADSKIQKALTDLLADRELLIADGHHRFETAQNFKRLCLQQGWKPKGVETFTHRMMALFPMEDPGLVVLPTHRIIHSVKNFDGARFIQQLETWFHIEPCSTPEKLYTLMDKGQSDHVFGLRAIGTKEPYYLLRLKELSLMNNVVPTGLSDASKALDVNILHTLILDKLLGIDAKALEAQTNVLYGRNRDKALARVGDGTVQATFLVNPTRVEQVRDVALQGERMPQKSTDFYPKLLTGLLMMKMQIEKP
ncbi:DUF1015 domain-containing protein [bacterium]|nr:DUF1015 domain-containing protein [bacterium]